MPEAWMPNDADRTCGFDCCIKLLVATFNPVEHRRNKMRVQAPGPKA